ncbi:hypothetical protein AB205_0012830 [Aquarana catesbeiana]|uniref:G-protein coupled receptors family 1 profile domain-containing protein n=1 Tax=Aquarana catesbeiana TaxID=8400 RepID=A0A2G9RJB3_AQUCT|nr:hypothetical protein AB205_0012830 [Aquarana catesbeiana]
MTKKKYHGLVILSFSIGFVQSLAQTSSLFSLDFYHVYCDIPPLVRLFCSQTLHHCHPFLWVFLLLKFNAGRRKAFSTCSSHLTCVSIFYVTVFCTYLHPSSITLKKQEKVASVFYTVVTPMLHPLIYSLRNQEVKKAIIRLLQKSPH